MTKVVRRGAGRAEHAEKTTKHAQRTPLPSQDGPDANASLAVYEELGAIAEALPDGWRERYVELVADLYNAPFRPATTTGVRRWLTDLKRI